MADHLTIEDLKGRKSVNAVHMRVQGGGAWMFGVQGVPRLTAYRKYAARTRETTQTWHVDGKPMPDLQTALDVINGVRSIEDVAATDAAPEPAPPRAARPMLAFTIWQPWASLIMVGAKPFEFRPASYLDRRSYRISPQPDDRVVIHAAARPVQPAEVDDLLRRLDTDEDATGLRAPARPLLERVRAAYKCRLLPLGAGLGTAVIGAPRNAGVIFGGLRHDSDRGEFNWAWPLTDIRPFDTPIPMRGHQGFWAWPLVGGADG